MMDAGKLIGVVKDIQQGLSCLDCQDGNCEQHEGEDRHVEVTISLDKEKYDAALQQVKDGLYGLLQELQTTDDCILCWLKRKIRAFRAWLKSRKA